jgi:hypothetical protein
MEPTPPSAPIKTTRTIVVPMKTANAYSVRIDTQSPKREFACNRCVGRISVFPRGPDFGRSWDAIGRLFAQRGAEVASLEPSASTLEPNPAPIDAGVMTNSGRIAPIGQPPKLCKAKPATAVMWQCKTRPQRLPP